MRGLSDIAGLRGIKTMLTGKKRSIPRMKSSVYLDLYMLKKEKDRLEKEMCVSGRKDKETRKKLDEISKAMVKLQKEGTKRNENIGGEPVKTSGKDWKKMDFNY